MVSSFLLLLLLLPLTSPIYLLVRHQPFFLFHDGVSIFSTKTFAKLWPTLDAKKRQYMGLKESCKYPLDYSEDTSPIFLRTPSFITSLSLQFLIFDAKLPSKQVSNKTVLCQCIENCSRGFFLDASFKG